MPHRPKTANPSANDMSSVLQTKVVNYEVRDILAELEVARAKDASVAASGFSTNPGPTSSSTLSSSSSSSSSNTNTPRSRHNFVPDPNAARNLLLSHARRRSTYAPVLELPREEAEADAVERQALLRASSLDIPSDSVNSNHRNGRSLNINTNTNTNTMSRTSRPTHIPLPNSPYVRRSPNGSPLPTPSGNPASPTSPRSSFLPSFMRTRSRAATLTGNRGRASPSQEIANPLGSSQRGNSSELAAVRDGITVTRSTSTPQGTAFTNGASAAHPVAVPVSIPPPAPAPSTTNASNGASANNDLTSSSPSKTFRIRLVPHLESTRSLAFDPVIRELHPISVPTNSTPATAAAAMTNVALAVNGKPPALLLRVGRFTDKTPAAPANIITTTAANGMTTMTAAGSSTVSAIGQGPMSNPLTIAGGGGEICSGKIAFKSKVVSRTHAEIWCEAGGKFFIRDTSSSSGTFLNHIRLSSPNTDSRPTQLNDGDVLQLGVDYQGGQEDMFRCVKMRVELGREWQRGANEFNTNALKQLKALGGATPESKGKSTSAVTPSSLKKGKSSVTDCCICLFSVTVCQSLFIAPCSHVFHYKCIRPLLMQHHPGFSCPLCRTFANLEEDVETEDAWELVSRRASVMSRRPSHHSAQVPSSDNLRDLPITGPFAKPGGTSVSVEHLLHPDLANDDEDEHVINAGEPENPFTVPSSLPLEPQHTAVVNGNVPVDLNVPHAVQESEEDDGMPTSRSTDSQLDSGPPTAFIQTPSTAQRFGIGASGGGGGGGEETASIPLNSNNPFLTSFSNSAATPINETDLSTLAPGLHQRLDLADAIDSTTASGHSTASGSRAGDHGVVIREEVDEMNGDMMDMELDEHGLDQRATEVGHGNGHGSELEGQRKVGGEGRRQEASGVTLS